MSKPVYAKGHGRARVLCKLKQRVSACAHLRKSAGMNLSEACDYINEHFPQSKLTLRQAHQKMRKLNVDTFITLDTIATLTGTERQVCSDIARRQQHGIAKYGQTVAQNPLSETQWLQHAYEEALDLSIYLKRLITLKTDIEKDMEDRVNERNEGV